MKLVRRLLVMSIALAVLVLIGVGASVLHNGDAGDEPEPAAAPPGGGAKVVVSGFVDVEEGIISLYPLQPGRVVSVPARENQPVAKNAELLRLDDRLSRLKLQQAKADLEAAAAKFEAAQQLPDLHKSKLVQQSQAVEVMRKRLSAARHKADSAKKLFDKKLMNKDDYEAVMDQIKEGEAGEKAEQEKLNSLKLLNPDLDVRQARANADAKKAQLAEAQYALDQHVVRAPADGVVLRVNVGPGEVLGPIPRDAAVLFSVNKPRIIRVNVEQEFAQRVKAGFEAEVQDYINPDSRAWKGKVARIADVFMQTRTLLPQRISFSGDDTRTLECIVILDEAQAPLRLGQRVRVTIRPKSKAH